MPNGAGKLLPGSKGLGESKKGGRREMGQIGLSSAGACQIKSPFLGLRAQHEASWTCAGKLACVKPSSSIAEAGALH